MTTDTAQGASATAQLHTTYSMSDALLTRNLDGVTAQLATARPGDGNPIAWSLGHIVYWRQAVIAMLGGTPVWREGEAEGFKGTSRELPATIDRDWPALLDAHRESRARLMKALEAAPPLSPDAVKGALKLQCHETYHVGQIALARRVIGLPGVI